MLVTLNKIKKVKNRHLLTVESGINFDIKGSHVRLRW